MQGEETQKYGYHPKHHILAGLLARVRRRSHGHFLLHKGGGRHQQGDNYRRGVRLPQVQPEEPVVQGRRRVNRDESYPGIQLPGKFYQMLRVVEQGISQDPEQTDQNGHLNNQRPQAAHRAYPRLPVEAHSFLRDAGPVAAVPLLDFPHPGLQFAHPPHLANLLQGQRQGD